MAQNFEIVLPASPDKILTNSRGDLLTIDAARSVLASHNCNYFIALHPIDDHATFLHYHIGIHTSSDNTFDTIAGWFGLPVNSVNKIRGRFESTYFLYLCHMTDAAKAAGKTPIDPATIENNFRFDYNKLFKNLEKKTNLGSILQRIDSGEIRPYNVFQFVDVETYAHKKPILERAFQYYQNKNKGVNREMKCLYYYGAPGTGKTTAAKEFAISKGYSVYISSGGKNPLDDYAGEDCIILDDIRGSTFPLNDFLKLTDPNTDSLVGCRYYNKSISYCRLLIVTSVFSPVDLYAGVTDSHKEPLKQLLRRFELFEEFQPEKIKIYVFDGSDVLLYKGACKNHISLRYNPKFAKATLDALAAAFGLEVIEDPFDFDTSEKDPLEALQQRLETVFPKT